MTFITKRKEEKINPEEMEPPGSWVESYNLATTGETERIEARK
jgi:hypothetical protein